MSSEPAHDAVQSLPAVHCAADYESLARERLPAPLLAHLAGGSGEGATVAENRAAYARHAIVPRLLVDVSRGSTRIRLVGREYAHPFLLAPLAHQRLVHPRGELATARGAAAADACMVLSTLSSFRLEEVATVADGAKWFQLYFQSRREDTLVLVERARNAGYEALVVTLDAPVQPPNLAALRAGFRLPADVVADHLPAPALASGHEGSRVFQGLMARAPTWADLEWLVSNAGLPVWVKGVLDGEARGWLQHETFELAIVDLNLASSAAPSGNRDGFFLLRAAKQRNVPALVVSALGDPDDIDRAYDEFGIFTFVEKEGFDRRNFERLVETAWRSRQPGRPTAEPAPDETPTVTDRLTPREREVLALLTQGYTNRQIAEALLISANTTKKHVDHILQKLGASTRAGAVALAMGGNLKVGNP